MPRPSKPDNILRLTGHWRRDRHGPIEPPQGKPLSAKPPKGLPSEIHQAWRDVVAAGDDRLVEADAVLVECAARSLAAIRSPEARGQDSANLLRAMAALGLDPVHRRAIKKPEPENEFNQF